MTKTAIILAGGFGTRLQSVVNNLPKPMAPVNLQPFLNYQLRYLKHYGIKKVVLSLGYLNEKIQNYYANHFEGLEVMYVVEKEALGTGGGIRLAMEACHEETVLALNGDSFFDMDLAAFYNLHTSDQADISIALRKVENAGRYGTIAKDSRHFITSFSEKSGLNESGIINAGIYLINTQKFLQHTQKGINFSIEKDFFEKQLSTLKIKGYEFGGYFIDIGIPEDYQLAQHDFKEFKYR